MVVQDVAQWYVSSDVMNVLSCSADVLMHDVGLAVRVLCCISLELEQ